MRPPYRGWRDIVHDEEIEEKRRGGGIVDNVGAQIHVYFFLSRPKVGWATCYFPTQRL